MGGAVIYEFKLPDIGEGLIEGEIVEWMIKPGDAVKEDQALCSVLTEKATVEIPSPVSGTILELLAEEGQVVPVKSVIVKLDTEPVLAGDPPSNVPEAADAPAPEAAKGPTDEDDPPALFTPTKRPPAKKASSGTPAAAAPAAPVQGRDRILASPATRKLARELGVDLAAVLGTGSGGRVTREDVQKASTSRGNGGPAAPASAPRPAPVPAGEDRRVPLRGLRRKIAERMSLAKKTAVHYSYLEEADVSELVKLRAQAKTLAAERGVKLSFLPFFVKAAIEGLKRYPRINALVDEESQELICKGAYHIGIATDTEQGLLVPVIRDADRLDLFELAREIVRVTSAARDGKAVLDELRGSTFTITNVGSIGGLAATPVLNIPEVGIMGVGAIRKRPWVVEDRIAVREILVLSMTFDHRFVDGAEGARFTNEVKRFLENPGLLALASI